MSFRQDWRAKSQRRQTFRANSTFILSATFFLLISQREIYVKLLACGECVHVTLALKETLIVLSHRTSFQMPCISHKSKFKSDHKSSILKRDKFPWIKERRKYEADDFAECTGVNQKQTPVSSLHSCACSLILLSGFLFFKYKVWAFIITICCIT